MTIDMKRMSIDLKHREPHGPDSSGSSDTQLRAAKAITRDFILARTALALGAGWLGLISGLLIGRW